MKRLVNYLRIALVLAIALPGIPPDAITQAQSALSGSKFYRPAAQAASAVDTDVAIVVKYVGGLAGTNTVAYSAPNLAFVVGGVADTTITGCGGTAGSLDVSNAACNTFIKTLNRINLSPNWRAVLVDVIGSDTTTSNIVTLGATDANAAAGVNVLWKTSASFTQTRALVPCRTFDCLSAGPNIPPNPYRGYFSSIKYLSATSTYGSGTSTLQVLSVKPGGVVGNATETVTTLLSIPGGATTVNVTKDASFFGSDGFPSDRDAKIVVRIVNSAALSVPTLNALANIYTY